MVSGSIEEVFVVWLIVLVLGYVVVRVFMRSWWVYKWFYKLFIRIVSNVICDSSRIKRSLIGVGFFWVFWKFLREEVVVGLY